MKKILAMVLAVIMMLSFTACGQTTSFSNGGKNEFVEIKTSPDKYTWYIKNYVGKNCASFGDTWGGRYDKYGKAEVMFVFIADDNSFVDPYDDDCLKQYVVTAQSIKPNTELKLVFETNEDGTEGDTVISQNIEEIELYVTRINNTPESDSKK